MPICYCRTGGYGQFLQVVEQKPVQQKVEERQETEPAKHHGVRDGQAGRLCACRARIGERCGGCRCRDKQQHEDGRHGLRLPLREVGGVTDE